MKSRVETRHLGQIGKSGMKRLDQQDFLRQMFRIERAESAQFLNHIYSDSLWLAIKGSTMNYAMPHRRQCIAPAAFLDPVH